MLFVCLLLHSGMLCRDFLRSHSSFGCSVSLLIGVVMAASQFFAFSVFLNFKSEKYIHFPFCKL